VSLPVKTGFPFGFLLPGNYRVRWRAVDPTTGNDVSGVVISQIAIQGDPQNVAPNEPLLAIYEMPGLTTV